MIRSILILLGIASLAFSEMTLEIKDPTEGQAFTSDSLTVNAMLVSTYDIKSVTAKVGTLETHLSFKAGCSAKPGCLDFTGAISLAGLPRGDNRLEAEAIDVHDERASAEAVFRIRGPLRLIVDSPADFEVATPMLHIKASCESDAETPCKVSFRIPGGEVQARDGFIDTLVDLGLQSGSELDLRLNACDEVSPCIDRTRMVYVETSPYLTVWRKFDGEVLNFRYDQVLFADVERQNGSSYNLTTLRNARIFDTRDSSLRSVGQGIPERVYDIALTPSRAAFILTDQHGDYRLMAPLIYENKGDSTRKLFGFKEPYRWSVLTNGNHVALKHPLTNWLVKDAEQAAKEQLDSAVSSEYIPSVGALSESGELFVVEGGVLSRMDSGKLEPFQTLDFPDPVITPPMLADAGKVLVMLEDGRKLFLLDGSSATLLGEGLGMVMGSDVMMRNGWIAFGRNGNLSQQQVWLRNPEGKESQITEYATGSRLYALAPNGELVFAHESKAYLAFPDGSKTLITNEWGRYFHEGGKWYFALGNTVFSVHSEPQTGLGPSRSVGRPAHRGSSLLITGSGPAARLQVTAARGGAYDVVVVDLGGKERKRIHSASLAAGRNILDLDIRGLENGFYPIRLELRRP